MIKDVPFIFSGGPCEGQVKDFIPWLEKLDVDVDGIVHYYKMEMFAWPDNSVVVLMVWQGKEK